MHITTAHILSLAVLATSLVALPVQAAPARPDAESSRSDEGAKVEPQGSTRLLIFDGDSLEGEVLSPNGAAVTGRTGVRHASMVGIRPHFIPQLIRQSQDL